MSSTSVRQLCCSTRRKNGKGKGLPAGNRGYLNINGAPFPYSYSRSVLRMDGTSKQFRIASMVRDSCDEGTTPVMEAMVQLSPIRSTPAVSRMSSRSLTIPYRSPKWGPFMENVPTGSSVSIRNGSRIWAMFSLLDPLFVKGRQRCMASDFPRDLFAARKVRSSPCGETPLKAAPRALMFEGASVMWNSS